MKWNKKMWSPSTGFSCPFFPYFYAYFMLFIQILSSLILLCKLTHTWFRLMIKWNCCRIHGPICLSWITYIIDCTTIYPMKHHCIMVKNSTCLVWDCWVSHSWPIISMKYKTNCKSWNSMSVTTYAWNFYCC